MANSQSGESVIRRIAKIVGAFDGSRTGLTIAALARRAGLPLTTTYRMVDELCAEGLLERNSAGRLFLGTRLWEVISRSSPVIGLREAALPHMEDVQVVIGHHTALGVLDGDEVLYIERLGSRSSTINITAAAKRLPIHGASSGLVLLAYAPAEFQEEILGRPLEKFTEHTITDPAQLRRRLADVRKQGYSAMAGIIVPESSGVAVPVFGPDGAVIAALSVIVPIHGENVPATVPVLKAAARGISRTLGWQGSGPTPLRRSVPRP